MVRAATFHWIRCLLLGTVWILAKGANSQEADLPTGEAAKVDIDYFERHIRPVFVTECYGCHSSQAKSIQGGLRLDLRAGWQRGGDSGPALDTAHPERSLLLRAVQHAEDVAAMPPEKNLPVETVEHLRVWIAAGAPGPDDITSSNAPPASSPQTHWAFQLPTTPPLDRIPSTWARNRLDRLVEMGHRVKQLSPAAEVDRAAYARRIYQDLLGLPAPYEQIQSFLRAETPNAHEQLIDQLLASPRFGERWARLWLDVSRYADTKGYVFTQSRDYPDAHRYRDWVIRSFNLDRRYDEFIRYQLAADQLAPEDANELAAMGYLTLGRRFLNNRHDIIDDRIDVVSRGMIGLTVTCARCHSHKFDPIPIEDYYSLYGVFDSSDEPGNEPSSLRLVDKQEPVTPVVFVRGNPGRRGAEVPRQFLSVLSGADRKPFTQGSGRLELANAIASEQNPLTARVLVNRVWGRLMGQYLVDTPSDFGIRSQSPDLQPVLDDLAVSFMKHDWSIKWLVREIVSSSTYRQMASADAATIAADPENRYCTRMNRRRLDFEALRDSILSVTLELRAESIGGPSIDITKPDSVLRRSVYAFIDRQNLPGLFRTFDLASPDTHAPKRYQTTVPQQALYLMNSPFIWKAAASLGDAVRTREEPVEEKIVWLYRQVLSRDPADWERQRSLEFVRQTEDVETSKARWNELAQILLVCNEFVFID